MEGGGCISRVILLYCALQTNKQTKNRERSEREECLVLREKPISHESRSDECDFGFFQVKFNVEFTRQAVNLATLAKPNVFYFWEPRQYVNKGNPFKVNVNAFSRTFACEWFP